MFVAISNCKKENYYVEVPATDEPPAIDIVIDSFNAQGYNKQTLEWDVSADQSFVSYATAKIDMRNLHLISHDNASETTVLTSDKATMDRNTNDMIIKDNVVVKSSNGRELYTELLNWDSKSQELSTNVNVKIIYPGGEVIHGTGMKSNSSLGKLVVYNPVGVHVSKND